MGEFRMPSLGADMEAGKLVEWLKHPGDAVNRGDIIAVVETQKGAIEIEVFESGVLDRVMVEPGAKVPVGTPLAWIRISGEEAPPAAPVPPPTPAPPTPAAPVPPPPKPSIVPPSPAVAAARERVSPAARRFAAEHGVPTAGLTGTGPGGAVVRQDVERAAGVAPHEAAPRPHGIDLGEMRRAIAAAMAKSKREIPHYYLSHRIDMTKALDWLAAVNAQRPPPQRLLPATLLLKAVALALEEFPEFNGFYADGKFAPSQDIHIGTAIAIRGGGLVAPAILDADEKTLDELMASLRDLVARTRAGRLRGSELFGPTITVSSLGDRGVESLFGVIYPPQVAIVGFGTPTLQPWVVGGPGESRVEPRRVMTATLAADHRVSDGHRGALFLLAIEQLLNTPDEL